MAGDTNIDELTLDDNGEDDEEAQNSNRIGLKIGNFKSMAFGFFTKSNTSDDPSMGDLG